MRFYRMELYNSGLLKDGGEHESTLWFANRAAALQARTAWLRNGDFPEEVVEVEIEPTKAGILQALRRFASHADNG